MIQERDGEIIRAVAWPGATINSESRISYGRAGVIPIRLYTDRELC